MQARLRARRFAQRGARRFRLRVSQIGRDGGAQRFLLLYPLKAWPYYDINGEGVVYYPSLTLAEVPRNPDDRRVLYRLVDIFAPSGLWDQRDHSELFESLGSFAGDQSGGCGSRAVYCTENVANPPWGWDDDNDGLERGTLATDPAALVNDYFTIPEAVAGTYTFNPDR